MKGWGISFFYLYTNTSQQISKCFGSPLSCHVPFKRILHLSAGKSLSTKYQTNVSPLRILNLQSGQVAFVRSHRLMHALWKWWEQGSRYSSVPSTYGHRQIQHSESSGWRDSSLIWLWLYEPVLASTNCFWLSSIITIIFDRLNLYIGSDLISSSEAPSLILKA